MKNRSLLQRFMNFVNSDWQWTGSKFPNGYGQISDSGKNKHAHRVSYELFNGPIPEGMLVLHSCDDKGCVDPDHLHLGTTSMNAIEGFERGCRVKNCKPMLGINNGKAKLTEEDVIEIRKLHDDGESCASLSIKFHVSSVMVSYIVNRKNWKHVA